MSMLEVLVIAGTATAPLGSVSLFLSPAPGRLADNAASTGQAVRRFVLAVAGPVLLACAARAVRPQRFHRRRSIDTHLNDL